MKSTNSSVRKKSFPPVTSPAVSSALLKSIYGGPGDKVNLCARGGGLVLIKGSYHFMFYLNGKRCRRTLNTDNEVVANNLFIALVEALKADGVTAHEKSHEDFAKERKNAYIYRRDPFIVKVGAVVVGSAGSRKEARELRDTYLSNAAEY
jgi:hypothetical protein